MSRAIFLDGDGTIIKAVGALDRPAIHLEEFEFMPSAVEGLKLMKDLGYLLGIITNQSGVADGRWTLEQCQTINHEIFSRSAKEGVVFDFIYMCTDDKRGNCSCRKPKPGMFYTARERYQIDLARSYMVGNELKDILAGKNAGCRTIKLKDDYKEEEIKVTPDYNAENLVEAAKLIEGDNGKIKIN